MGLFSLNGMYHRLFVYGTLRKKGGANNLMKLATLIEEDVFAKGLKIYDRGAYPIALNHYSDQEKIVGDIYQLDDKLLQLLDEYEGDEYYRSKILAFDCWIYLGKSRTLIEKLPLIKSGDWIGYYFDNNSINQD